MKLKLILVFGMMLVYGNHHAQTITMGKKCKTTLEIARTALKSQSYDEAIREYDIFSSACKTRDAKEAAAEGKAEAYNGLKNYSEAITQADIALKITKNKSLIGHFQKARAQNEMGDIQGSEKSLKSVIALTEKNQNTKVRASNYALMASMYERQLSDIDSSEIYIDKAKKLDPSNVNYLIQEGNMYSKVKNFDRAFNSYDKASSMSPNNLELATDISDTRLRMMKEKYGTTEAQELRTKMTANETIQLCDELNKAKALGYKDMNRELFMSLVCKKN